MKNLWMPDPKVEHVLTSFGLKWELKEISLSQIDENQSWRNHARIKAIDPDMVDRYTAAMQRGDIFPAAVAEEYKTGKYLLHGGNQREAAAKKAGRSSILCYIISTDDDHIHAELPHDLNFVEGQAEQPHAVRRARAVRLHLKWGIPTKDAAARCGISYSDVTAALRADAMADRLKSLNAPCNFGSSALLTLSTIKNDNVVKKLAKIAASSKLTTEELQENARAVKSGTEAAQLDFLDKLEDRLGIAATNGHPTPKMINTPLSEFKRVLTRMENVVKNKRNLKALGVANVGDEADIKQRIKALSSVFRHLLTKS